jgi:5,6-dimethylbenzimidazole synthase
MTYESLYALVSHRRSFRRFKSDPLPEGTIEKVLDIARQVPSAGNSQPWEFVVVSDNNMKKTISQTLASMFGAVEKQDPSLYKGAAVQPHFFTAPVLIVVCGDLRLEETYPNFLDRRILLHQSMAICIYGMQLAAASLGLATAWGTIQGGPPETAIKKLLGIPEGYTIDHIIPIGYPDEESEKRTPKLVPIRERAPYRRSLEEIVHYGHFDMSKFRSDEDVKRFIRDRSVVRVPSSQD